MITNLLQAINTFVLYLPHATMRVPIVLHLVRYVTKHERNRAVRRYLHLYYLPFEYQSN